MFTFDLKVAKRNCLGPEDSVLIFVVRLENGRNLPVYLSTSRCLLSVMEKIQGYRVALQLFLYNSGYSYGSLKSVGYVE